MAVPSGRSNPATQEEHKIRYGSLASGSLHWFLKTKQVQAGCILNKKWRWQCKTSSLGRIQILSWQVLKAAEQDCTSSAPPSLTSTNKIFCSSLILLSHSAAHWLLIKKGKQPSNHISLWQRRIWNDCQIPS